MQIKALDDGHRDQEGKMSWAQNRINLKSVSVVLLWKCNFDFFTKMYYFIDVFFQNCTLLTDLYRQAKIFFLKIDRQCWKELLTAKTKKNCCGD